MTTDDMWAAAATTAPTPPASPAVEELLVALDKVDSTLAQGAVACSIMLDRQQAAWLRAALAAPPTPSGEDFQARVQPWLLACFGPEIVADGVERNHRFLEEALELVQSTGCTASEAHQLVDYVYDRDVGEPAQEVGGVMVTLAALCLAHGLDMHANGETELARIWTKVEKIRAKQAAKPKHSPLPQHVSTPRAEIGDDARAIKATNVLADIVPLSISSTWDDAEHRCIIRAMLAFAAATPDAASVTPDAGEIIAEAQFLVDRIQQLDWCDFEQFQREWNGHVDPPLYRLRKLLTAASHAENAKGEAK
jgi:hypothetical protein